MFQLLVSHANLFVLSLSWLSTPCRGINAEIWESKSSSKVFSALFLSTMQIGWFVFSFTSSTDSSSCLIHPTRKQSPRKVVLNLYHSIFQSCDLHSFLYITPISSLAFVFSFMQGGICDCNLTLWSLSQLASPLDSSSHGCQQVIIPFIFLVLGWRDGSATYYSLRVQLPSLMWGWPWLSVTLAAEDPTPLAFAGTCTHVRRPTRIHTTYTQPEIKNKSLKLASCSLVRCVFFHCIRTPCHLC